MYNVSNIIGIEIFRSFEDVRSLLDEDISYASFTHHYAFTNSSFLYGNYDFYRFSHPFALGTRTRLSSFPERKFFSIRDLNSLKVFRTKEYFDAHCLHYHFNIFILYICAGAPVFEFYDEPKRQAPNHSTAYVVPYDDLSLHQLIYGESCPRTPIYDSTPSPSNLIACGQRLIGRFFINVNSQPITIIAENGYNVQDKDYHMYTTIMGVVWRNDIIGVPEFQFRMEFFFPNKFIATRIEMHDVNDTDIEYIVPILWLDEMKKNLKQEKFRIINEYENYQYPIFGNAAVLDKLTDKKIFPATRSIFDPQKNVFLTHRDDFVSFDVPDNIKYLRWIANTLLDTPPYTSPKTEIVIAPVQVFRYERYMKPLADVMYIDQIPLGPSTHIIKAIIKLDFETLTNDQLNNLFFDNLPLPIQTRFIYAWYVDHEQFLRYKNIMPFINMTINDSKLVVYPLVDVNTVFQMRNFSRKITITVDKNDFCHGVVFIFFF